jgi:hypothetical protein
MGSNEGNNNTVTTDVNWNDIIKHNVRSIDDADLGKVQGLYEPFIVTEKGTINKEKFYIPKSLFKKYDGEILYFNITEQEAKDNCMRNTPPSEDETNQIVQTVTVKSTMSISTREKKEVNEAKTGEKRIVAVKGKNKNQQLKKMPSSGLSKADINEDEIVKKIKIAANDLRDIIVSGAKVAKQKIKERKEITSEKKADKDAEKISKMGDLATQFTSSFEDIVSEIRTRTYAEQEQIYVGFLKLMEQQRGLLIARRDLAAKLKGSVQTKPALAAATTKPHPLRGKEQPRLSKEPELPPPTSPQRQLPEIVTAPPSTTSTKEELKTTKPKMVSPSKKESHEQIKGGKSSGSNNTTEATVTEIPSAELPTKKQKIITATDKEEQKRKSKGP